MAFLIEVATVAAVIVGTLFSAVGLLGYIRLPDVYSRLHATGKVGVFGTVFLLLAAMAWTPLGVGKGLILILLLLIAGPVTSHALGSAAYRIGLPVAGHEAGQHDNGKGTFPAEPAGDFLSEKHQV